MLTKKLKKCGYLGEKSTIYEGHILAQIFEDGLGLLTKSKSHFCPIILADRFGREWPGLFQQKGEGRVFAIKILAATVKSVWQGRTLLGKTCRGGQAEFLQ